MTLPPILLRKNTIAAISVYISFMDSFSMTYHPFRTFVTPFPCHKTFKSCEKITNSHPKHPSKTACCSIPPHPFFRKPRPSSLVPRLLRIFYHTINQRLILFVPLFRIKKCIHVKKKTYFCEKFKGDSQPHSGRATYHHCENNQIPVPLIIILIIRLESPFPTQQGLRRRIFRNNSTTVMVESPFPTQQGLRQF